MQGTRKHPRLASRSNQFREFPDGNEPVSCKEQARQKSLSTVKGTILNRRVSRTKRERMTEASLFIRGRFEAFKLNNGKRAIATTIVTRRSVLLVVEFGHSERITS